MTRKELKLIEDAIGVKMGNFALDFAYVDFVNYRIMATDTRKAVVFRLNEDDVIHGCSGGHFVHKKMLKAIISVMGKDDKAVFEKNHIVVNDIKLALDNDNFTDSDRELVYPSFDRHETRYDIEFQPDDIAFIDFDTTHKNAHIDSDMFDALKEFGEAHRYLVKVLPQIPEERSVGMVRVEGYNDGELRFHTLLIGVEYKPQQPTLFDM